MASMMYGVASKRSPTAAATTVARRTRAATAGCRGEGCRNGRTNHARTR
jgi:hypothetical protein